MIPTQPAIKTNPGSLFGVLQQQPVGASQPIGASQPVEGQPVAQPPMMGQQQMPVGAQNPSGGNLVPWQGQQEMPVGANPTQGLPQGPGFESVYSSGMNDFQQGIPSGTQPGKPGTTSPNGFQTQISTDGLPELPGINDFSADRQKVEDSIMSRYNTDFARDEDSLRTKLLNQGLSPGSEAWNREYDSLNRAKTDARMQATLAGGQEQSRLFGLGSQARGQLFGERQATGEFANDANTRDLGASLAQKQLDIEKQNGKTAGLFGLGSTAITSGALDGIGGKVAKGVAGLLGKKTGAAALGSLTPAALGAGSGVATAVPASMGGTAATGATGLAAAAPVIAGAGIGVAAYKSLKSATDKAPALAGAKFDPNTGQLSLGPIATNGLLGKTAEKFGITDQDVWGALSPALEQYKATGDRDALKNAIPKPANYEQFKKLAIDGYGPLTSAKSLAKAGMTKEDIIANYAYYLASDQKNGLAKGKGDVLSAIDVASGRKKAVTIGKDGKQKSIYTS